MKRFFFPLLFSVVISGCADKNKLPKDVLPQPKMQAIMWDMMRAGDFLNNNVFFRDTGVNKIAEAQKWNEKIFQIHKITRKQFTASYSYYRQHPQLMKAIMDSISKIKVEDIPPATLASSNPWAVDSIKTRTDSLKKVRQTRRFNPMGKRLPNKTQIK